MPRTPEDDRALHALDALAWKAPREERLARMRAVEEAAERAAARNDDDVLAQCASVLSDNFRALRDDHTQRVWCRREVEAAERLSGFGGQLRLLAALERLGKSQIRKGEGDEGKAAARATFLRAVGLAESAFGADDERIIPILNQALTGATPLEATALARRAAGIADARCPPDSPLLAHTLVHFACALLASNEHTEAIAVARRASALLEVDRSAADEDDELDRELRWHDWSFALDAEARALVALGRAREAVALRRRALATRQPRRDGVDFVRVALHTWLATTLRAAGEHPESLAVLDEALRLAGDDASPLTLSMRAERALSLHACGRSEEAHSEAKRVLEEAQHLRPRQAERLRVTLAELMRSSEA
jgi:tetratricopeptide (TPR) repeat protein